MSFRCFSMAVSIAVAGLMVGCDPYGARLKGEFNAGAVDPSNFPPAYRGAGFNRIISGSGSFTEKRMYVGGAALGYFSFPFSPAQVSTYGYTPVLPSPANPDAPRRVSGAGALPISVAYVFDPLTPGTSVLRPIGTPGVCKAPAGYQYDPQYDGIYYNEQGSIFTGLPDQTNGNTPSVLPLWNYVPVVRQVAATSNGENCQDIKSEKTLLTRGDVSVPLGPPAPDGTPRPPPPSPQDTLLAFAIIDPGSAVYRVGQTSANSTGVTIQRWGWFQRFLLAYLDGGVIPVEPGAGGNRRIQTQILYYPRTTVRLTPTGGAIPGNIGLGADVMQFRRGDPNYSPVCQVLSYNNPVADAVIGSADLPRSAADIEGNPGVYGPFMPPPANPTAPQPAQPTPPPARPAQDSSPPSHIFCLQAQ